MNTSSKTKIERVVMAESDPTVREDFSRILERLAEEVELFSDGDNTLDYIEHNPPQIAIISLACWASIDDGITRLKSMASKCPRTIFVVTHRKILPKHLGRLARYNFKHVVGHPLDPLYLFRMAHEHFGVKARRFDRVEASFDVFWGTGDAKEIIGKTFDVGRGGIRLLTERTFHRGASLFIGLNLGEGHVIEARGEIVNIDDIHHKPQIGYGISFVDLRPSVGMLIEEAVAQLIANNQSQG